MSLSLNFVRDTPNNPNPDSAPNEGAPVSGAGRPQADTLPEEIDLELNLDIDREELLERFIGWWKASRDHYQEQRQETAECNDFVAGHQWSDDDMQILHDQSRPAVTFNRIGPFVDGVSGLEITNRQSTQYLPRQLGQSAVNELLTGAAQWVRDECDAEDEESEAFRDAIIGGVGWTQSRMDYDDDPDGMIKIDRVDPMEVYPDASSRKPNYADGQHLLRVKDIPVERAERMFPGVPTVDLHAQWAEDQPDETESPHNARIAPYYRIDQASQIDRQTLQCRLVEVEWWDYVTAWRVLDPRTGRFVRLSESEYRTLQMRSMLIGYRPFAVKDRQKRYYKAICGNVVLRVMRGADQGGFTYKAITGKRDRNRGTWYGLVRAMRDPQMWANKFFTQALHIVNVNAKGGLLAETDAFVDIEEARDDWASADSITELTQGGLDKVRQKEVPNFPVQINQMMQQAIEAIPSTAGINLEMIAQQSQQQPGVLEWQRKQQGMTVLAYLFNAKRRYQKEQGRLMLWMITTFIADGRLIRIGGPENAKYVPLIHQPGLAEYDVIVDDAPTSPNQKEKVWSMIMQMLPMLRSMPIPPQGLLELMRYSPFPAALIEKIAQLAAQQAQQPPMSPAEQSRIDLDKARAQHLQAQSQRTLAEAQTIPQEAASEATERQARIEQMRANAAAALAKAGIDARDARFSQLMDAVDALLQAHQQGHDQTMDVTGQAHDQAMDRAGHALDVYQAMNPPQPGGNAGNSGAQSAS